MQQADKDVIPNEADASFEIEAKKEPVEIEKVPEAEDLDESDPRAAIYKKHTEQRKSEAEGTPVGSEPTDTKTPDQPTDAKAEADELVKVKVNGKEREVARSKIEAAGGIDAYQKNAAASELLNQASAERRKIQEENARLEAKRQELLRMEQDLKTKAARPESPPDEGANNIKELSRKYHDALIDGDMDTASDLLVQIQAARNATANPDDVAIKAAERVRQELAEEARREAAERRARDEYEAFVSFNDKYPDLRADPELFEMTDRKTVEVQAEHPDWSPAQIVDEAAVRVREWLSGKTQGTATGSDKLQAKREMTTVRGGSAKAINRPAPKPVSPSQYVESLRKARGLE